MQSVLKRIIICMVVSAALTGETQWALAQAQPIKYPSVAALSSIKPIANSGGSFKRSLTFSSGEVAVGIGSNQVNPSDLVDSLQYLAPGNRDQGLVTLCSSGIIDNSIHPECVVVGIARSYQVQKENMQRWVADTSPQLIGQAQWDVTPKNNLYNVVLRNSMSIEPAFDKCLERVLQPKNSVQSCFQTATKDEISFIVFRLCYGEMKLRENGLDLNSNLSTPITFCAVDRKTGLVSSLFLDETRGRVTVALSAPISLYELYARSTALETQQTQKQYTPPKL